MAGNFAFFLNLLNSNLVSVFHKKKLSVCRRDLRVSALHLSVTKFPCGRASRSVGHRFCCATRRAIGVLPEVL